MKKTFPTISFYFIALVIIFLPFQGLASNILEYHANFSASLIFWLVHWYELVLLVLFSLIILFSIRAKNFLLEDFIAIILLVFGISLIFFSHTSGVGREIEGFRFTLSGILFFLFARLCNLSDKQKRQLIHTYLFLAALVAVWGLFEKLLPIRYWGLWGLINPNTIFGYGWHNISSVAQIASVLGGPNQLASYLLPAFFLLACTLINPSVIARRDDEAISQYKRLPRLSFLSMARNDKVLLSVILSFLIAVLLTYSRSAILGLLASLFILVFLIVRKKWLKIATFVFVCLLAIVFLILYKQGNELLTHGGSQAGHANSFSLSLSEIKNRIVNHPVELIFGAGLGTAGPIVLKYGDGLISESWYLQLILELGLVGFTLWLTFVSLITIRLFKTKKRGLALGLIAVSIAAIFLHTFADNPAMTLTFFLLIGVSLKDEKNFN